MFQFDSIFPFFNRSQENRLEGKELPNVFTYKIIGHRYTTYQAKEKVFETRISS